MEKDFHSLWENESEKLFFLVKLTKYLSAI